MQYLQGAVGPSNNSLDIYRNLQNIEIPFISGCFILTVPLFNENEKKNNIHLLHWATSDDNENFVL